jgi:mRNA interferase MazF
LVNAPDRGDFIWLDFDPQAGHEQGGHRPALVLSPKVYNTKTGMALCCPITTKSKGFAFEVPIPQGGAVKGVILADHIKNLDWRARGGTKRAGRASPDVVAEVLEKLDALLGIAGPIA